MKDQLKAQFDQNISRVENLVGIYDQKLSAGGQGRRPVHSTDVLRAATVLLHASLEDFVRGLASWKWPAANVEILDKVPLLETSKTGRVEKFNLGALAKHRNMKVDTLIAKSIDDYLQRFSSVSDTTQLASMLESCGVNVNRVSQHFTRLDELMERRHHIVHQADKNTAAGSGQHSARSIGMWKVERWIRTTRSFVEAVLDEVDG